MQIILVGFMGSGKTTIGQLLAERLQLTHHDLDDMIIDRAGKTIPQIFEEDGEHTFRQLEHDTLREALVMDGILSTGGGTPIRANNLALLQRTTVPVILLDAKPDTIMTRLADGIGRPLVKQLGLDGLVDLKAERDGRYHELADIEIATDQRTPKEVVELIMQQITTLKAAS